MDPSQLPSSIIDMITLLFKKTHMGLLRKEARNSPVHSTLYITQCGPC